MKRKRQRGTSSLRGVAVSGGFRAGKRRKGNSLIKRSPVVVTYALDIREQNVQAAKETDPKGNVYLSGSGAAKLLQYRQK